MRFKGNMKKSVSGVTRLLYRAPYCNVIMMARLFGGVSREALKGALAKARIKYRLLGSRIQQDNYGNISFSYDCDRDFPIFVHNKKTDSDWLGLAWNEQQVPFEIDKGPLIKFLLVGDAYTTDLIVICHHCICDGLSLTYLVKDIAAFLRGPDIKIQPMPVPPALSLDNLSVNIPVKFTDIIVKLFSLFMNRAWKMNKILFSERDYRQLYMDYWKTRDIGLLVFSLSQEETGLLVNKCHKEQVTVNSALTTAFSLAQYDVQGDGKPYLRKALLAIDIRRFFKEPPGENFGLLAVGNEIRLPRGRDGFWDVARRFNGYMKKMLACPEKFLTMISPLEHIDHTLLDSVYFTENKKIDQWPATLLKNVILSKSGNPKRSLDITNLGVIGGCDEKIKTIFFLPILSTNYEKTFGIVTVNGGMNIVLMHDRAVINPDIIGEYKRRILGYLTQNG